MIRKWLVLASGALSLLVLNTGVKSSSLSREVGADTLKYPARFGWGRPATDAEIKYLDIDVRPDGKGLPAGYGNAKDGQVVYANKCVACHGTNGYEGPYDVLLMPADTVSSKQRRPPKVIANYWPYATTLFDYIRRAMPYNEPGSLTDAEVYQVTAYLLWKGKLWSEDTPLDRHNLPQIEMPAKGRFVPDNREESAEIR